MFGIADCTQRQVLTLALQETERIIAEDAVAAKLVLEKSLGKSSQQIDDRIPIRPKSTERMDNLKFGGSQSDGLGRTEKLALDADLGFLKKEGNKALVEFFTQGEGKCNWIPIEAPHKTPSRYMEFFLPTGAKVDEEGNESEATLETPRVRRVSASRKSSMMTSNHLKEARASQARQSIATIKETLNINEVGLLRKKTRVSRKNAQNNDELEDSLRKNETPLDLRKRKKPCAVCQMRFPINSLTTSISRQAVYRLRQKWAREFCSMDGCEQPEQKYKYRLYDELKVCLFCSQLFDFHEEAKIIEEEKMEIRRKQLIEKDRIASTKQPIIITSVGKDRLEELNFAQIARRSSVAGGARMAIPNFSNATTQKNDGRPVSPLSPQAARPPSMPPPIISTPRSSKMTKQTEDRQQVSGRVYDL